MRGRVPVYVNVENRVSYFACRALGWEAVFLLGRVPVYVNVENRISYCFFCFRLAFRDPEAESCLKARASLSPRIRALGMEGGFLRGYVKMSMLGEFIDQT